MKRLISIMHSIVISEKVTSSKGSQLTWLRQKCCNMIEETIIGVILIIGLNVIYKNTIILIINDNV